MKKKFTHRQLAQLAGVSPSTVSKVFAGNNEISAATRERILKLSEENGVLPPRYNHSRSFPVVAVFAAETVSRFSSQTINIISEILLEQGIIPTVCVCGINSVRYRAMLESVCEMGCIGIISLCDDQQKPQNIKVPFLRISYRKMIYGAFSSEGQKSGIAQAVRYLVSLGHTRIGYIGKKENMPEFDGFRQIIQSFDLALEPEFFYTAKDSGMPKSGDGGTNDIVEHFLSLSSCPTALISSNDEVAISTLDAFRKKGIRVPEDISVIGVGNTLCSTCGRNMLTTVEVTIADTVGIMVKMFVNDIYGKRSTNKEYLAPQSRLIIRETTAKPRDSQRLKGD